MSMDRRSRRRTVVRFRTPRRARIPLVEVIVDDGHRAVFIVDTGASGSALSADAAARFGISTTGTRMRTLGASGAVRARQASVRSLSIGGLALGRLSVAVIDLAPIEKALSRRIDGVLGTDVLRRFVVTIDYRGRTIALSAPGGVQKR
jgi:hypothetical protein